MAGRVRGAGRRERLIARIDCFRITAGGPGLREVIPLAVPGPDYGTLPATTVVAAAAASSTSRNISGPDSWETTTTASADDE
jgi:hypothetical protein